MIEIGALLLGQLAIAAAVELFQALLWSLVFVLILNRFAKE